MVQLIKCVIAKNGNPIAKGISDKELTVFAEHHIVTVDIIGNLEYIKNCYSLSEQMHNKGWLTLLSKDIFPFEKDFMSSLAKFGVESFMAGGNGVISNELEKYCNNERLRVRFLKVTQILLDEELVSDKDVLSVYEAICLKVFHAWAGEQTQKQVQGKVHWASSHHQQHQHEVSR